MRKAFSYGMPFFESMGYEVVCDKKAERRGVELANFRMAKRLS